MTLQPVATPAVLCLPRYVVSPCLRSDGAFDRAFAPRAPIADTVDLGAVVFDSSSVRGVHSSPIRFYTVIP
jgi:hypothetical protein